MSVRSTALAVTVIALALVVNLATASAARAPRDRTAPTTPTNLRITASGPTSISIAWNASTDNSSNWWYCVQRDGLGCFRVDPPQTTFTLSKLWPNSTYNYSVVAIDAAGNRSGRSNTVTHKTPPDTTPPTAPTLSVNAVWPTRISVSWTQSVDNLTQVWYTLLVNGSPYGADLIGYRSSDGPGPLARDDILVQGLGPRPVRKHHQSNVVSVTTPAVTDTVPPSAPTNLRLSSESDVPEIWLDWDQSTDDTDPQSQIMYDVYLNGVPEHAAIGYGETVVYCRGEGPNTIVVRAVDTSGNISAPSNQIVFC